MKTLVNLDGTVFSFPEFLGMFRDNLEMATVLKNGIPVCLPDFGNVIIGDLDEEDIQLVLEPDEEPLFKAPTTWRMPQLLKALGAFESTSAAAKNGWNMPIPDGLSIHIIKIARVKGVITIFKKA